MLKGVEAADVWRGWGVLLGWGFLVVVGGLCNCSAEVQTSKTIVAPWPYQAGNKTRSDMTSCKQCRRWNALMIDVYDVGSNERIWRPSILCLLSCYDSVAIALNAACRLCAACACWAA